MRVEILFFGRYSDLEAPGRVELPDGVDSLGAVADWLRTQDERFAAIHDRTGNSIVVNGELVRGDAPVSAGDEIAFLSMASGG